VTRNLLADVRVVHLIERSVRGERCSGNWKDITSFNSTLREICLFREVIFEHSLSPSFLRECKHGQVTHVIVAYSKYPEVLAQIRKAAPATRLFVRAHNAEALQHWHRAEMSLSPTYGNLRSAYGILRLLWRDTLNKRISDGILGISEWDNTAYWNRLPGRAKVYDVPYVSPWPGQFVQQQEHRAWLDRENVILCMPGGRDPIGRTMLNGFAQLASRLQRAHEFKSWRYWVSPGVQSKPHDKSHLEVLELLSALDEPWNVLCSIKAVAVLTPLGFGFKTTIADALAAGCHVLVHPKLAQRLRPEVRSKCIVCDPENLSGTGALHARLSKDPGPSDVNEALKRRARRQLMGALTVAQPVAS
jgi:hypothetical protein